MSDMGGMHFAIEETLIQLIPVKSLIFELHSKTNYVIYQVISKVII